MERFKRIVLPHIYGYSFALDARKRAMGVEVCEEIAKLCDNLGVTVPDEVTEFYNKNTPR